MEPQSQSEQQSPPQAPALAEAQKQVLQALENQRNVVAQLKEARERITALSNAVEAQEAADAQPLIRGARLARQLQNDLSEIARRIDNVKKVLGEVQRIDANVALNL